MAFPAKYPSKCTECGGRIETGDPMDWHAESRTAYHPGCTPEDKKWKPTRDFRPRQDRQETSKPSASPLGRWISDTVNETGKGPRIIATAFNTHNAEAMRDILTKKDFFVGSDEQETIWNSMLTGERHIIVNASAGSGKTFTAQQGILRLIRDQDASARSCTYHALGNSICKKNFPMLARKKPNQYKLNDIMSEFERPLAISQEDWYMIVSSTMRLTKMAKNYLLDGTDRDRLEQLADFFGIETNGHSDYVYNLVPRVIRACLDKTSEIDFQDMIFFPTMMDLRGDAYDLFIADEVQDADPAQRKLFQLACPNGRIMGIGDQWQSLYSWRGADVDSMEQLHAALEGTARGVTQLPLTVTRRCPQSHVALAQAISGPGVIEALPDAPLGEIKVIGESQAVAMMRPGDLVVCRVNRFLIPAAYALIKRGIKAIVRGRDIGDGLVELIHKLCKRNPNGNTEYLIEQLEEWSSKEIAKLEKKGDRAIGRIQQIEDSEETIWELCEGMDTIPQVVQRIEQIFKDFNDDGSPVEAVILGTLHRTKGLQGNRVFVLHSELMPHPMAGPNFYKGELCAIYVAVTRAKWDKDGSDGELYFIGPVPEPIAHAMPVRKEAEAELDQPDEESEDPYLDGPVPPKDDDAFWDQHEPPGGWQGG
jgi:DNA helicase II / ATP-dependent DNA helicase PcrA